MENSSSSYDLNNLPDLVYNHILKNLDLDDLWNSRLISKRFYSIIKNYNINELNLSSYYDNWFSTLRPPRSEYQLLPSKQDLLRHPSNNLLNLKYLRIKDSQIFFYRLDGLNKFTKLQILEIGCIILNSNDQLQLPDLKALDIHVSPNDLEEDVSVVIDTPNLHSLAIQSDKDPVDDLLKFNHPHSIKYLRLDHYDNNAPIFTNLECLELYFHSKLSDLFKFKNLKSLKINARSLEDNELKDIFRLKKDDMEFVIAGVRIKNTKKIDECKSTWSELGFQLNNYDELENDLWFANSLEYSELVSLLPDYQLDGLLTKFTNIQIIWIESRIEDGSQLIRFIRGCPNLHSLEIRRSSLDQQFYDQLPTIKSLSYLEIDEEGDLNLDFKFLNKIPYLNYLLTDQDILIDSQLNLNNFKRLRSFRFVINNRIIEIEKEDRDRYKIEDYESLGLPVHDYIDHNKLVEWSNQLRCKK